MSENNKNNTSQYQDLPGESREDYIKRISQNYITFYSIPEVRKYFAYVVSAIMLAFKDTPSGKGLKINYRFKSPKGIEKKIGEYYDLLHSPGGSNVLSQPLFDAFAMKLVTSETPTIMYSKDTAKYFDKDKTLHQLVQERKENNLFLEEMQRFRSKLLKDEFANPPTYNLNIPQSEYFRNCIAVLERTKSLLDSTETDVIEQLDDHINSFKAKLTMAENAGKAESPISQRELDTPYTNFLDILNGFENRMNNELSLALLTRRFTSLINSQSEILSSLGIQLTDRTVKPSKRKRKPNGYEANFIYMQTFCDDAAECQLQDDEQEKRGKKDSLASHLLYKNGNSPSDKMPMPVPLPTDEELAGSNTSQEYLSKVLYESPSKHTVSLGGSRTHDIEYGAYRNYYSNYSEIPPDHPYATQYEDYFAELTSRKNSPLKDFPEVLHEYNIQDIENYINSPELVYVSQLANFFKEHHNDFAQQYNRIPNVGYDSNNPVLFAELCKSAGITYPGSPDPRGSR